MRLYSESGNINLKNSPFLVYEGINAYKDINLDRIAVQGDVSAEWGQVTAKECMLEKVTAYRNVDLADCRVKDVCSLWGSVFAKKIQGTHPTEANSIIAYKDIELNQFTVDERVQAQWGKVTAQNSKINRISAYNDIEVTNSDVSNLNSLWGSITIRSSDGKTRQVNDVAAHKEVYLENCKVHELY